jgi:predicted transcriptional regulator
MEEFAGEKVGQKSGEQWRGTDKGTPGKKIVGDSIIKDLSKGVTPKTKEQELAEEWATFSEENIGTHPKRARRTSDRHARGHEPQARYKTVKADEVANPAQQAAIAIAMKKDGKKPKNEGAEQDPIVAKVVKQMRPGLTGLDMGNEAFLYFAYELGKQRARDAWSDYLPSIRAEYEKGLNEDANTDNKLAKLLTRFINQNEGAGHAVASDAIEYIKKIGHIEQFATSLDYFGVDLDEGSKEDGPVEARWMVKVSDDEGDHLKTYHRKFPSLSAAKKAYKKYEPYASDFKHKSVKKDQVEEAVMGGGGVKDLNDYVKKRDYIYQQLADIKQKDNYPYFKQALFDLMRTARQKGIKIEEGRAHDKLSTWFKDRERAQKFASGELKVPTPQERRAELDKQKDKKEKVDQIDEISQKLAGDYLDKVTKQQVSKHGIQPNMYEKLPKNRQKGVSNAFNRLQVDPKEKVDEYGANNPAQTQQVAANLNTQKTALGQLKQLNPEIDPQKAAMAVTKDVATMSPQEKEELAQVAKTISPALGTPALGSIKTAIQKSQLQAKK